MPKLDPGHRRALELLAEFADGCTEAILLAHGFSAELIDELIGVGFAAAKTESLPAGRRQLEITRIRITIAGRVALTEGD